MILDYYKIQNEVMKSAWANATKNKAMNWYCGKDDENLYLTDGYAFYIIPKPFKYLDEEIIFKNSAPFGGYRKILDAASDTCEAIMTNRSIILPDGKKTAIAFQIENAEHEETYIDKDLLKFFDVSECKFRTKNKKSLIYIFTGETLLGAVLPVKINV